MTTASVATVVMYHFVQPRGAGPVAGLKAIDLTAFREQLAYIRRHYTPVSPFDLVRSAADWWLRAERPMLRTELAAHLTDLAWAGLSGVVTPDPRIKEDK